MRFELLHFYLSLPIFCESLYSILITLYILAIFFQVFSKSTYNFNSVPTQSCSNDFDTTQVANISYAFRNIYLALQSSISNISPHLMVLPQVRRLLTIEGENWHIGIRVFLESIHMLSFLRLIINWLFINYLLILFRIKTWVWRLSFAITERLLKFFQRSFQIFIEFGILRQIVYLPKHLYPLFFFLFTLVYLYFKFFCLFIPFIQSCFHSSEFNFKVYYLFSIFMLL